MKNTKKVGCSSVVEHPVKSLVAHKHTKRKKRSQYQQYLDFCDWLFSLSLIFLRFNNAIAFVSTLFLSMVHYNSLMQIYHILFIHHLINLCCVLWLLWLILWTFGYKLLCKHIQIFLCILHRSKECVCMYVYVCVHIHICMWVGSCFVGVIFVAQAALELSVLQSQSPK